MRSGTQEAAALTSAAYGLDGRVLQATCPHPPASAYLLTHVPRLKRPAAAVDLARSLGPCGTLWRRESAAVPLSAVTR